jgi:hypothetical protein
MQASTKASTLASTNVPVKASVKAPVKAPVPVPRKKPLCDKTAAACPIAMNLLSKLRKGMERIPTDNPSATAEHRLREFGGDPSKCIHPELEDWEDLLNPMMKNAFGWGAHEMNEAARSMLHRGQYGLDGFVNFIEYFVTRRRLMGGMIEGKVTAVLEALESACVTVKCPGEANL